MSGTWAGPQVLDLRPLCRSGSKPTEDMVFAPCGCRTEGDRTRGQDGARPWPVGHVEQAWCAGEGLSSALFLFTWFMHLEGCLLLVHIGFQ